MTVFDIGDQVWTTKDGKKIRYRDLEIKHIINIAKKPFVEITGSEGDGDVETVYFDEEMELELLRRMICKMYNVDI